MIGRRPIPLLALLGTAGPAFAYIGSPVSPGRWWAAWNLDPVLLLNLGLVALLYDRGLCRLWRAGVGRAVSVGRAAGFAGGVAILVVALLSPVDPLSDELSWVHMVQHMLLMNVAAPLLVAGAPALAIVSGVPDPYRSGVARLVQRLDRPWLWNPVFIFVLFALALWLWHLPVLYLAALRDPVVHDLEHLTFFGAAVLLWRLVLDPISRRRLHPVAAVAFLFATSLQAMGLGVFMALSTDPWYGDYAGRTAAWGLSAIEDQQLAGAIMWMPGGLVYALTAAGRLALWIRSLED